MLLHENFEKDITLLLYHMFGKEMESKF